MSGTPALYRLAVFDTPGDRSEVAAVLREQLSLVGTDAAIQARLLPGLIHGEFPHEAAERAAQGVAALGYAAAAVPSTDVPVLHPCETPHHLRWPAEGLQVVDLRGEVSETVPWSDLELISVGQVPQESVHHSVPRSTSVVAAGRHQVSELDSQSRLAPGPEAWLICRHPGRVYRLDHKRMNYEFLGDRLRDSATTNFRTFLEDLVARASGECLTPATQAFLAGEHVAKFEFKSSSELERATVLTLLQRRRANSAAT